ncbi:MAG: hypothetical protein C5B50_13575 [Verrucomicrobia bacterium]|nr:MAG: hypothetical protein C5B50_13575 [Verrucomicrobiota bacterium]
MNYFAQTRWGGSENLPDENRMREILAELEKSDPEHPDTWLTHESGWTLSVYESGLVIFENMESGEEPRHQLGVSREKALELWLKLSRGEIAAINQEPWRAGQAPARGAEEREEIIRKSEAVTLALDREFYDRLAPERTTVHCRHAGCQKGAIPNSVFCRVHHFENIRHRPCPFHD